jgi:hypothetical protein
MKLNFACILVLTLAAAPVSAHHSVSATYDLSRKTRIEGEIAQFLFRNPHSMIHVSARDSDGNVYRWAVEWAGVGTLSGSGVTRATLRIGDHVAITGNPGRNPEEHLLRLLSIERPVDGWSWKGASE